MTPEHELYRFRIKVLHDQMATYAAAGNVIPKYSLELLDRLIARWPEANLWACEREFKGIFKRFETRLEWPDMDGEDPDYETCMTGVVDELKAFVVANPNARFHVPAWTYAATIDTKCEPVLLLGFYYN